MTFLWQVIFLKGFNQSENGKLNFVLVRLAKKIFHGQIKLNISFKPDQSIRSLIHLYLPSFSLFPANRPHFT